MSAAISGGWVRGYVGLVGAMDFLTGVALVAVPALTLRVMGVGVPGAEALGFVRFVGVFVGAVGASYLLAVPARAAGGLRAMLGFTLVVRASVGLFTGAAVAVGMLERGWLVVTVTDLGCAVLQAWILTRREGSDG
jgi:hypothetical protein